MLAVPIEVIGIDTGREPFLEIDKHNDYQWLPDLGVHGTPFRAKMSSLSLNQLEIGIPQGNPGIATVKSPIRNSLCSFILPLIY